VRGESLVVSSCNSIPSSGVVVLGGRSLITVLLLAYVYDTRLRLDVLTWSAVFRLAVKLVICHRKISYRR
jgi:hypothetical protein